MHRAVPSHPPPLHPIPSSPTSPNPIKVHMYVQYIRSICAQLKTGREAMLCRESAEVHREMGQAAKTETDRDRAGHRAVDTIEQYSANTVHMYVCMDVYMCGMGWYGMGRIWRYMGRPIQGTHHDPYLYNGVRSTYRDNSSYITSPYILRTQVQIQVQICISQYGVHK